MFAQAFRLTSLFALALLVTDSVQATSLPETYPMPEADSRPFPVDPYLAAWLDEHVERPVAMQMNARDYGTLSPGLDAVSRLFLDLARANRSGKSSEVQTALAAALKHLQNPNETQTHQTFSHPLVPFLYEEILKIAAISSDSRQLAMSGLNQHGAGSCAQKDILFAELTQERIQDISEADLRELIEKLDAFRAPRFRNQSFRKLVAMIPESRREAVGEQLVRALAKNPSILMQVDWLKTLALKLIGLKENKIKAIIPPKSALFEPYFGLYDARKAAQKDCAQARNVFLTTIQKTVDDESLEDTVRTGKVIDGCFKARSPQKRVHFWESALEPMRKAYGFAGWAEVKLRIAYIYWVLDDFKNAKALFDEVRLASAKEGRAHYEARAIYTLGRVAEDEDDRDRAMSLFRDYINRFVDEENFEEAQQSLVLAHFERKEWVEAGDILQRWMKAQSLLSTDERSVSGMSFALFWAGRIKLEQGDPSLASELWRRAAAEYFSTYYGAISHFMLEKLTKRVLAMQPARTPAFRMTALRQTFEPVDRQRVRRVEMLMRLGLRAEAACELDELGLDPRHPEKQLVKALMLHASGQWLEAIKLYDALPRSFRFGLSIGFERLVFPRSFAQPIYKYASAAKIDPDLVMALIRQESVFNPTARSPVGALGLMQLMPNTAKGEAAKLSVAYVPEAERKQLKQLGASPISLLVPEVNLAIGIHHLKSLLETYRSPVFVLSAYNASPSAAQRWINTIPTQDLLTFIERIPYKETRAYVKLVLRNYFYYKRWYGPASGYLRHLDEVTSHLLVNSTRKSDGSEDPVNSD